MAQRMTSYGENEGNDGDDDNDDDGDRSFGASDETMADEGEHSRETAWAEFETRAMSRNPPVSQDVLIHLKAAYGTVFEERRWKNFNFEKKVTILEFALGQRIASVPSDEVLREALSVLEPVFACDSHGRPYTYGPLFLVDTTVPSSDLTLHRFNHRIEELFLWHKTKDLQDTYMCPLLPIVQSSGTGKTLLMHRYRWTKAEEADGNTKRAAAKKKTGKEKGYEETEDEGYEETEDDGYEEETDEEGYEEETEEETQVGAGTSKKRKRREETKKETGKEKTIALLISCMPQRIVENGYDHCLSGLHATSGSHAARDSFVIQLEALVSNAKTEGAKRVVLLLDEAQNLLGEHKFYFRCLQWFLKLEPKPSDPVVVGVVAGTSQSLGDVFPETVVSTLFSRLADTDAPYMGSGTKPYAPFLELWTTGSMANRIRYNETTSNPRPTEYDISIQYGRPLFARTIGKDDLASQKDTTAFSGTLSDDDHASILDRMLLGHADDWRGSNMACLSLLATRLQLGSTHAAVTSELVARGYANLIYFKALSTSEPAVARFCYLPDPVCARLAMCMMVDGFEVTGRVTSIDTARGPQKTFHGASRKDWSSFLLRLLSGGLCHSPRGDVGEVAAALYMLFCGDRLRCRLPGNDKTLTKFSISVVEWIALMEAGGGEETGSSASACGSDDHAMGGQTSETGTSSIDDKMHSSSSVDVVPTLSFIQVSRNDLRCVLKEEHLHDQAYLRQLYDSAQLTYLFEGCMSADAMGACRFQQDGKEEYVPLLVSVKTRQQLSESEQQQAIHAMVKHLGERGICLLLVVDPDMPFKDYAPGTRSSARVAKQERNTAATHDVINNRIEDSRSKVVARIICISKSDVFGISNVVRSATRLGTEMSEVYGSHAFLDSLVGDTRSYRGTNGVLRSGELALDADVEAAPLGKVEDLLCLRKSLKKRVKRKSKVTQVERPRKRTRGQLKAR